MTGTATVQGELWGARSRDWAEVQEGQVRPLFEAVLDRLDAGCGAGLFCKLAADAAAAARCPKAVRPL